MNKLIFYLIITSLLFTSCKKFLDLNPTDQPSSATFWKTVDDMNLALTACYGTAQNALFSYSLPCWDNIADNGYGQHAEGQYGLSTAIAQGNIDPTTGGFVSGVYTGAYSAIARVNIFLSNLSSFTGTDEATKKRLEAEAKMIRAFFYSYLYRCYGEVPVVTEPLTLETQFQPKSPAADVLKLVMDDIDFGIANLPDLTYKAGKGRWTKNAAKAYKARMILYTAYNADGTAITAKMTEAKDLLTAITGYSLAPEFTDNSQDSKQEANPEIMMSVKFLAPNNATSVDMWYGDWIVVSPLANLINEFENLDGTTAPATPITGKGIVDITKFTNASAATRDPRLAKTIFIDKYIINGATYTPSNGRPLNTGMQKFLSVNQTPPFGYSTLSQQDWVIMRYADVLLMLAEAENEVNGATAVAYKAVNDIRARAEMPALLAGLSKDAMRQKIRHERRVELAFEGQRYFDLKRWKIAKQVLNGVTDGLITYKFEDKHYLWPLPQGEIDKSNGKLIQNPDYK